MPGYEDEQSAAAERRAELKELREATATLSAELSALRRTKADLEREKYEREIKDLKAQLSRPRRVQRTLEPGQSCVVESLEHGQRLIYQVIARPCPSSASEQPLDDHRLPNTPMDHDAIIARFMADSSAVIHVVPGVELKPEARELLDALRRDSTVVALEPEPTDLENLIKGGERKPTDRTRWFAVVVDEDA